MTNPENAACHSKRITPVVGIPKKIPGLPGRGFVSNSNRVTCLKIAGCFAFSCALPFVNGAPSRRTMRLLLVGIFLPWERSDIPVLCIRHTSSNYTSSSNLRDSTGQQIRGLRRPDSLYIFPVGRSSLLPQFSTLQRGSYFLLQQDHWCRAL